MLLFFKYNLNYIGSSDLERRSLSKLAGTGSGAHHSGGFRIFRLCRKIGKGVEIKIHPQSSRPIDGFFWKKDPQRCGLKGPELAHPRRAGNFGGLRDLAALRNQGTDQARFRYLFDAVRGRNPQPQRLAHHGQLNLSNRFHSNFFFLLQDPKPQRVHDKTSINDLSWQKKN